MTFAGLAAGAIGDPGQGDRPARDFGEVLGKLGQKADPRLDRVEGVLRLLGVRADHEHIAHLGVGDRPQARHAAE